MKPFENHVSRYAEELCQRAESGDTQAAEVLREKCQRLVLGMPADQVVGMIRSAIRNRVGEFQDRPDLWG